MERIYLFILALLPICAPAQNPFSLIGKPAKSISFDKSFDTRNKPADTRFDESGNKSELWTIPTFGQKQGVLYLRLRNDTVVALVHDAPNVFVGSDSLSQGLALDIKQWLPDFNAFEVSKFESNGYQTYTTQTLAFGVPKTVTITYFASKATVRKLVIKNTE